MSLKYGYIGYSPDTSPVVVAKQVFSPTGVQTNFTFAAGYQIGYLDVYLNGARQIEGQDFSATDTSTVGLSSAAQSGDILELVAYKAYNLAAPSAVGNFTVSGNLTVNGTTTLSAGSSVSFATTAFNLIGIASTATAAATAYGLSGTPNITVGTVTGSLTGTASTATAAGTAYGLSGSPNITVGTVTGSLTGTASTATAAATAYGLSGTPNITVGNVTGSAATFTNLTVNGTQTIINTTSLEVADKNIGIGSTTSPSDVTADGAGITIYGTTNKTITWNNNSDDFAFSNGIDIKGAVETVSVGSTYDLGGGRVVLECDARNGTVFTHDLANGIVGITSLKNFPATKNSATTFTILFTQNATGTANTTAATGIGTNIRLTPFGVSGFTTTSKVATASTITLSTTALDVDIVSFMVHYNGSGTGTPSNYKVYVTNNTGFRYGSVGF
jgi:hypothetical protein